MQQQSRPRIGPQPPEEWHEAVRDLLNTDLGSDSPLGAGKMAELNLFTTVARNPVQFKPLVLLGRQLLAKSAFTFVERELLILRTGLNCGSAYEWGQHAKIAANGGIERVLVERIVAGPDAPGWDGRASLLLRAADELHLSALISTETWSGLHGHLDERQLIELPLLVGYYHLVAFTLNALNVQPEPGLEPLPVR